MKEITLGGCYHTGMVYALGYDANGVVELDDKIFTNFDTGLNGGAVAALNDHRKRFDADRDLKRFIVALKPIKIMDEQDETTKCKRCHILPCAEKQMFCETCIYDTMCCRCFAEYNNCDCGDYTCRGCDDRKENAVCNKCCCDGRDCLSCHKHMRNDQCLECEQTIENCFCDYEDDEDFCDDEDCEYDEEQEDTCAWCGEYHFECQCQYDNKRPCDCGDEFCKEFVSESFKSMNAFARARWIRAQEKYNC